MTDDQEYKRVTVGEVARRLDRQDEYIREFRKEVLDAIHDTQGVPRGEYQANLEADRRRIADAERFIAQTQEQPARTLRGLVSGIVYPLVAACIGAIATIAAKAKGL